jgi:hypothetical protein
MSKIQTPVHIISLFLALITLLLHSIITYITAVSHFRDLGVNFINVLRADFTHIDLKRQSSCQSFLHFRGLRAEKDAR